MWHILEVHHYSLGDFVIIGSIAKFEVHYEGLNLSQILYFFYLFSHNLNILNFAYVQIKSAND